MTAVNSALSAAQCEFRSNRAGHHYGAGIYGGPNSTAAVSSCLFAENRAEGSGATIGGGAIKHEGEMLTVTNSAFVNNVGLLTMGGSYPGATGGATQSLGKLVVRGSYFGGNQANNGGALAVYSAATIVNSVFSGNHALSGPTLWTTGYGGAIAILASQPSQINLEGVTIAANTATEDAGGIYFSGFGGAATPPLVENSILWGNRSSNNELAQFQEQVHGPVNLWYDDIDGLAAGIPGEEPPQCPGCMDADPLFVGPLGVDGLVGTLDDDLRLAGGSPVIDAADNSGFAGITTDMDGNSRFVDDPNTADTGLGTPPVADMGAYEFGSAPAAPTPTVTSASTPVVGTPTPTSTATPGDTAIATATSTVAPSATPTVCVGVPMAPVVVDPPDGTTLNVRRVWLDWTDVSCAMHYEVVVRARAIDGRRVGWRRNLTESQYRTRALRPNRSYFWQVRACNTSGCGGWSVWSQFNLVQ